MNPLPHDHVDNVQSAAKTRREKPLAGPPMVAGLRAPANAGQFWFPPTLTAAASGLPMT